MLDRKAKVKSLRKLGGRNYLLTLVGTEQARLVQPGQFVMVKCSDDLDGIPLLRRPFSIFNTNPQPGTGRPGGLDLLVKDVGFGSHRLARLSHGDEVYVLGPQGRPFRVPDQGKSRLRAACLVAGGVGIAALYLLAQRLTEAGITAVLFYGGRSADDLVLREYFEKLEMQVCYTTEDGSLGGRGLVTEALERFLVGRSKGGVQIYACGPWAMMKAVHRMAVRFAASCEVSLEARMGCSIGACMGCVVQTADPGGEIQFVRVCQEGPVMDSRIVDWETPPL